MRNCLFFKMTSLADKRNSYTLVELLVTVAILGVLAATVVIILNPSQLLAESRDSKRISELAILNKAVSIYIADDNHALGSANIVYVSVPDATSTCASLALPALPTGWSYHCATTSTLRNVNGTGWIPINFNLVSHGLPISVLPTDPVNSASSGEYYTYATNGSSHELTAYFESDKYQTQAASSGNIDPTTYATGNNLSLTPFLHGMIGYWNFDDSGAVASDSSGFSNTGTMYSSSTANNLHTATGCLSKSCAGFDGAGDYINDGATPQLNNSTAFTVIAWIKPSTVSVQQEIIQRGSSNNVHGYFYFSVLDDGKVWLDTESSSTLNHIRTSSIYALPANQWHQVVGVARSNNLQVYVDGKGGSSTSYSGLYPLAIGDGGCYWRRMNIGARTYNSATPTNVFNGLIDDLRVYNRGLTTAQVQAIYSAEKLQ